MESTHFAPLPLGSDAFMPPMAPRSEPPEPNPRRWAVVGIASLGVIAFGTVIGLTLLGGREPEPIAPEPRAVAKAAVTTEAATETRPGAIAAAAPSFGAPSVAAALPLSVPAPPIAQPSPTRVEAPTEKASAPPRDDDDGERERHHSRSHRSSRSKEAQLDKPSREQVLSAMSHVSRQVKACLPGGRGSLTADIKIVGKTARVTTAQISGQKGEVGSCIAQAVRKAKFPKFTTESISIRYPMAF